MFFSSQVTDMPDLLNYEQALAHYNTTTPIRGSDVRPICKGTNGRRKKHMEICKRGDVVVCRLYGEDLLEFHPNGDIFITTGEWCSQSHLHFINALLPYGLWANVQQRKAILTELEPTQRSPERREHVIGAGLTLRHVEGTNEWEIAKSEPNYSYRARRKVMYLKMLPVRHFITECIAFSKLYDLRDKTVQDEFKLRRLPLLTDYDVLKNPDHKDYSEIVLDCLQYSYTEPDYWSIAKHGAIPRFDPNKIKEFVRDIVKFTFAEELFERVEVDKISRNNNYRYFCKRKGE